MADTNQPSSPVAGYVTAQEHQQVLDELAQLKRDAVTPTEHQAVLDQLKSLADTVATKLRETADEAATKAQKKVEDASDVAAAKVTVAADVAAQDVSARASEIQDEIVRNRQAIASLQLKADVLQGNYNKTLNISPTTTAQEDMANAEIRKQNKITWWTRAFIATIVTLTTMGIISATVLAPVLRGGQVDTTSFGIPLLSSLIGIIIGFYFNSLQKSDQPITRSENARLDPQPQYSTIENNKETPPL